MLHVISSLVLVLILAGVWLRRSRGAHMAVMLSAFATDLALLLYVEITRHAVETVVGRGHTLVYVHAAISVGVLAGYAAMLVLGRRAYLNPRASRHIHRRMGVAFVVVRGLNYVTAMMM